MTEITNKIYYVGVNDRNKHRFEGLWPLPNGVSYNSYIIDDEKVALVDTVEVDFFTQFLENIHEVIGDREIDYLIINHMEPDHSGSIALIKKYYPNIKIVGNKKTLGMLEGFYGVTDDVVEVKNGETLSRQPRAELRSHPYGSLARDHGYSGCEEQGALLGRCLRLLRCAERRNHRYGNQLRDFLAGDGSLLLKHCG